MAAQRAVDRLTPGPRVARPARAADVHRDDELLDVRRPEVVFAGQARGEHRRRLVERADRVRLVGDLEHGLVLREMTKTGKRRTVPLLPGVVEALKPHRLRQLDERLRYKGAWEDLDLIFPNRKGGIMRTDNLRHRHFKPLLRAAGLPNVRLYHLRHSFSTPWVESGEDLALLQRILGHTSIKTTADVYVHLGETSKKRAMERFGRNLRGPRDPRETPKDAG